MIVKCISVGVLNENVYIYYDEKSKDTIIIDPGAKSKKVYEFIEKENLNIKAIILTHGHFDHVMGVEDLKEKTGAIIVAPKKEDALLKDPEQNLSRGFLKREVSIIADKFLEDLEIFELGNIKLKMISTPGHTEGSACFYDEENKILFSGDTIFKMDIGRTDVPTGSHEKILQSIKEKVLTLNNDVIIYPGHGESTSVNFEKENNPYI